MPYNSFAGDLVYNCNILTVGKTGNVLKVGMTNMPEWVDFPVKEEIIIIMCEYCGQTTDKKFGACEHCGAPLPTSQL